MQFAHGFGTLFETQMWVDTVPLVLRAALGVFRYDAFALPLLGDFAGFGHDIAFRVVYRVALNGTRLRMTGSNLMSSSRSGVLRRFLVVV